jgi:hypothetical protein
LEFRNRTIELYPELFGESQEIDKHADKRKNFSEKWGWYGTINAAANNDITKYEAIGKTQLFQVLTWLAYNADKDKLERQILKSK